MTTPEMADDGPPRSPAERVSDIPELLVQILLNLDLKHTTRVQRVSRQWQAIVQDSNRLRDGIFGTAEQPKEVLAWERSQRSLEAWEQKYEPRISRDTSGLSKPDSAPLLICKLHPLLHPVHPATSNFSRGLTFGVDWEQMLRLPAGPWENQLITQPPCRKVNDRYRSVEPKVADRYHRLMFLHLRRNHRPSTGHLTLGDLRDAMLEEQSRAGRIYKSDDKMVELHIVGSVEESNKFVVAAREHEER